MIDLVKAQMLANELPLFRDRLSRAGLYRTMHAMQDAQDMIAKEMEDQIMKERQGHAAHTGRS